MNITILGSSGQIGAYLTEYLREKGHEVKEFDVVNGSEQDLTVIPNILLEDAIQKSDFVFFLAFDVGITADNVFYLCCVYVPYVLCRHHTVLNASSRLELESSPRQSAYAFVC